jgi:hypothetical protein
VESLFQRLKEHWREFKKCPAGTRFEERYRRRHSRERSLREKALGMMGGLVVSGAGALMLFVPGPGLLVLFVGLVLIAQESRAMACALDWTELRGRALLQRVKQLWRRRTAR